MNIKDIVNREIVNLTNCESEPIHIPGSIQPHGFLLGVQKQTLRIDYCSENISDYVSLTAQQVLGKSLFDVIPGGQAEGFLEYSNARVIDTSLPFVFELDGVSYNTTVHQSGETVILELEPFPDGTLNLPNLYSQTRQFVSIIEKTTYLNDLCQEVANETREITGYDRVLIYKFDEGYNGEVIAESRREGLDSFSGQKYPHTDIPAQARQLYIKNQLRMIADINYTPVPLLTLDNNEEKSNQSLDLSLSILRSVSPIHVEYMKNMGVGATLTISLLQNQRLWGLIACHHYEPKILPHYTRLSALLQGHFLSSQITVREVAEEFDLGQEVDKALTDSLHLLHDHENFIGESHQSESLLKLANATGAVILNDEKLYKNGLVPNEEELLPLLKFLAKKYPTQGFHTTALTEIYPEAKAFSKYAAGIIYHSIAPDRSDGILWLRKEEVETISWAGNPEKAMLPNEDGFRLSPRKSFELWKEEVKDKSKAWRKAELNAAANFSYALQKHVNFRLIKIQEDKNRILNEELQNANKELANLNWISTHDLKEPLRKIQIFASKVLDREDPDLSSQVKDSVERMRFAAEKMQMLIEDVLAYSKAGSMDKVFEQADFNDIFNEVVRELRDTIEEKNAQVTSDTLPQLKVIPFQVRQLFINMISNALKFTRPGVTPVINVSLSTVKGADIESAGEKAVPENDYYKISFADNGIGFEEEYKLRIFDVFQRLHPAHKFPGTGIGLAICKKIMENHKGFIEATSVLGEGSTFSAYFPSQP